MARDKPRKLPFTLLLISLSVHLFVFAASSHEYVWKKPDRTKPPLKFRILSVEKPEKKNPPNPQSRFLSTVNRIESGSGKSSNTPRIRRESEERIPSRRDEGGPKLASQASVPVTKVQTPATIPASPKPPAVVTPKPQLKKMKKSNEKKLPETLEKKESPKSMKMARLTPGPNPDSKVPPPAIREFIKPRVKPNADVIPEKKKIEIEKVPKQKREPKPVVRHKKIKRAIKKKPRKENEEVKPKNNVKEKLKLAALKPISSVTRTQRPLPKRSQPKDPLALFRVNPQPRGKPKLPKFDLTDEAADRIAKKSLLDKNLEKEAGETISLDTRDFRYASYFAHIKRRIQNAWIWPAETQKNTGKLLLRFKLKKNGTLEELRLIKSAGIRLLDDLAMAAVTKAAPFEPFPEGLELLGRKSITATFVYE